MSNFAIRSTARSLSFLTSLPSSSPRLKRNAYCAATKPLPVLTACDNAPSSLGGYTYRAEVGYCEGDKQTWFVGTDKEGKTRPQARKNSSAMVSHRAQTS